MSDVVSGRDPFEQAAESFLQRLRVGERPSLAEYVERYPHLADEIREFFPALVMMEQLGSLPGGGPAPGGGPPARLGDYRILREVGRGGMGVVYEALQESLGRHVALKVLPRSHGDNSTRLERFRREARAAAALHHSNVVPVFGVGEDQGIHYFAMQYIAGQSLATVLREVKDLRQPAGAAPADPEVTVPNRPRPAPPADSSPGRETAGLLDGSTQGVLGAAYFRSVARVGSQVARALEYAHEQGVLHRDVKPANLLLDAQGTVWLSDFGLAKVESAEEMTDTGDVVGTLRYLAPERFAGKADPRSDTYALALTLYEMATLRPAFDASDRLELVEQIRHGVALRPRQIEPGVPRDLETIILKGCDREVGRRYQTAGEMAADLEAFLTDRAIKARPMPVWQRAARWAKRRPGVALLLGLLLVTFIAGLSGVLAQWRRATLNLASAEEGWAEETRQRQEKDEALRVARDAVGKKELALGEKDRALEEAKTRLYLRNVALADLHWGNNRVGQAKQLLDECPADRRGWEWHYLSRRCNAHLLALKRPGCAYVRFSPDGKRLALVAREVFPRVRCFVEVRDAASGRLERTVDLEGHNFCCVWQGGGVALVATATRTETYVSNVWTGERLQTLPIPTANLLFHPDGKHLGQLDGSGKFHVWQISGGTKVRTIELPTPGSNVVAFSRDGKGLLVRSFGKAPHLQMLDAQTGKTVRVMPEDAGMATYPPSGEWLALYGGSRFRLGNAQTGAAIHPLLGIAQQVRQVAFSPDAFRLASGGADGLIIVWHCATGRELVRLRGHGRAILDLTFDPAGRRLASCDHDGRVFVFDTRAGQDASVRKLPDHSVISADGRRFVSGSQRVPLRVRDLATMKQDAGPPIPLPESATLSLSPSVDQVAAIHSAGATLAVWDVKTGRQAFVVSEDGRQFSSLAFGQGGLLACACFQGGIELREAKTGRLIRTLPTKWGTSGAIRFSPDGGWVAAISRRGRSLSVWDVETGAVTRQTLPVVATCLTYHPSGGMLGVGFQDGTVALCVPALGVMKKLGKHESAVETLAFHGGGQRLASSSEGAVKVWDVERGVDLLELALPERIARVLQLQFVGDELMASASGLTNQLIRWNGAPLPAR